MMTRGKQGLGLIESTVAHYLWWLQKREVRKAEDECEEFSPAYLTDHRILELLNRDRKKENEYCRWILAKRQHAHRLGEQWCRAVKDFVHRGIVLDAHQLQRVVNQVDMDAYEAMEFDERFANEVGKFISGHGGAQLRQYGCHKLFTEAHGERSLNDLIAAKRFDSVDSRLLSSYPLIKAVQVNSGGIQFYYELLFSKQSQFSQIVKAVELLGLRPASLYEILSCFNRRSPFRLSAGSERSIYALGDRIQINGVWMVPRLRFVRVKELKDESTWWPYTEVSHLELVECDASWQSGSVVWAVYR